MKGVLSSCPLVVCALLAACSSARFSPQSAQFKGMTPVQLYEFACSMHGKGKPVAGEVAMKVKSHQISGQFSAHVQAHSLEKLNLEVEHPWGGVIAQVRWEQNQVEITIASEDPPRTERSGRSWSGLPLSFVSSLFLGSVPCPDLKQKHQLRITPEGELWIEFDEREQWLYQFKIWKNQPWPERLVWRLWDTKRQKNEEVEIHLNDPDQERGVPLKWEIRQQDSFIKVRWKDRASD